MDSAPQSGATGVSFDAGPLTNPIDPSRLKEFVRDRRSRPRPSTSGLTVWKIVVFSFVIFVFVLMGSMVFTGILAHELGASVPWLMPGVLLIVIAAIGGGILLFLRSRHRHQYRLATFAQANGMTYQETVKDTPLPGMIFGVGHSRASSDLIRGSSPRFVEFANYQYTTGSGKSSSTHSWGYIAIRLDVPLPNIVLDATSNNGLFGTNLPAHFSKDQRLSLEGDFDRYFALYCPSGYERDALYLFTPDIMARFMDNAAAFDVEIVDDWMLLYAKQNVSTMNPAQWATQFTTVRAVITKLDQWARWRDERLHAQAASATAAAGPGGASAAFAAGPTAQEAADPAHVAPMMPIFRPPGVARPGQRLRRSTPWIGIVIAIVIGAVWVFGRMIPFLH